jgi:hypothetical protein
MGRRRHGLRLITNVRPWLDQAPEPSLGLTIAVLSLAAVLVVVLAVVR